MPIRPNLTCKFCLSADLIFFSAQERMLGMGGQFKYSECLNCGSIQQATIPDDLSAYYPSTYYSFMGLRTSDLKIRILKNLRMKAFLWLGLNWQAPIYGYWLKKLRPGFSDSIADVGCGNGQLLYELYSGGFKNLHGFDPYIETEKQITPELKLWKKRIEESELSFDLIMMHHSFEHMEDPGPILKASFEKLNPGGKLLIRCPVADAEVWKTDRELWVQLDAPRHLIIPSLKGLKLIAEQSGFVLDEVEFDSSDFQFWATELYKRGLNLDESKSRTFLTAQDRREMQEKALKFNQEGKGDQACFYLRKPIKA